MKTKATREAFIQRAEELRARRAANALLDGDEWLDPQHWVEWCDDLCEYYIAYAHQVERWLDHLLVHHAGEPPAALRFLGTVELERRFPPMDESDWGVPGASSTFGPVTATIRYALAKVLVSLLLGGGPPSRLRARGEDACAALWGLWGPSARTSTEADLYRANEMLLDLAFGKYREIVRRFERDHAGARSERESAQRSLIRQCYLLARIATGTAGEDDTREAAARAVLLKYDYLSWSVKDNPLSACIDCVPMALASWLFERLTTGAAPSQERLFASMAPRAVVEATAALRGANRRSRGGG